MSEYKVIFKAGRGATGPHSLTWEPGCPVQITAAQVSRNIESSATFLQVKVLNVSGEQISSIAIESEFWLSTGKTARTSLEYLDVDIAPAVETTLKPQQLAHANITACKLTVKRVDSPRGAWQSEGFAKPLPARKELQLPPEALSQRAYALESETNSPIVGGSVQDRGSWWICACGQVNVCRNDCCTCGNSKQVLLENENEAKLLEDANARFESTYEKALELAGGNAGTSDLQKAIELLNSIPNWKDAKTLAERYQKKLEEKKATQDKKTRRIVIAIASTLAGIISIVALAIFIVIPIAQYNEAAKLVSEANFEAAANTAGTIGGIKKDDAQSLKREAQYQYAVNNLDRENETTYEYLKDLSEENYEDSNALFNEYFSPKVEIALVKHYSTPTDNDWDSSPVIAEMMNRYSRPNDSFMYDIWIRAYCPIESTLEVEVDISAYEQSSSKGSFRWSGRNTTGLFGQTDRHTFYPGTDTWCLRTNSSFQNGLQLREFYNDKSIAARVTVKGADGEVLCEKELQSPDYAASHKE